MTRVLLRHASMLFITLCCLFAFGATASADLRILPVKKPKVVKKKPTTQPAKKKKVKKKTKSSQAASTRLYGGLGAGALLLGFGVFGVFMTRREKE